MTNPLCHHVGDVLAVFATVLTATVAPMLLTVDPNLELLMLLLPLLGALLMTGAAILLNPEPETRRIVIGRSIIALLFGVAGPQVIAIFTSKFAPETIKPIVIVLVGAVFAFVSYILSKPFFNEAYKRSENLAKLTADEVERRAKLTATK